MFCGPETADVSRGGAKGNIGGRGITKHTAFPRSQSISVLLYTNYQRKTKELLLKFFFYSNLQTVQILIELN